MATRLPKHLRELAEFGWTQEMFWTAQRFFAARGISVGWNDRRREWFASAFRDCPGCAFVLVFLGIGALVEYLDAPSTLIRDMVANGAKIKSVSPENAGV